MVTPPPRRFQVLPKSTFSKQNPTFSIQNPTLLEQHPNMSVENPNISKQKSRLLPFSHSSQPPMMHLSCVLFFQAQSQTAVPSQAIPANKHVTK